MTPSPRADGRANDELRAISFERDATEFAQALGGLQSGGRARGARSQGARAPGVEALRRASWLVDPASLMAGPSAVLRHSRQTVVDATPES